MPRKKLWGGVPIYQLAKRYGYASSYQFSRAFRREIGRSPRLFMKGDRFIPDIPVKLTISGQRVYTDYIRTDNAAVYGYPVRAVHGNDTDLLKECAYHMDHYDPLFDKVDSDVKVSFWWSDTAECIYYVLGSFDYFSDENTGRMKRIEIPGTSYAVFSVERTGDEAKDLFIHREMVRYALRDWIRINRKKPDRMYYTYEVFDKTYTYLYVPLQADTIRPALITSMREMNIDNWISYIDSRIRDDITVKDIAAHFQYSETHFRRTFRMYFEMTPQEYIQKRRLYLAASELSAAKNEAERKKIANRYYFHTPDYFDTLFLKEFHIQPKDYRALKIGAIDLAEYYIHQKDSVSVTLSYWEEVRIAGFLLEMQAPESSRQENPPSGQESQDDYDIPELVSYWMTHDPDEILGTSLQTSKPGSENKAAVWYSEKSGMNYEYVVGYVLRNNEATPADYITMTLKPGKYAVFASMEASDRNNMAEVYRMLLRCSFYGWIKDNRFRVDFSRLTYVRFINNKFYFYIPINE